MSEPRKIPDVWWCDIHERIHTAPLSAWGATHRKALHPVYVHPRPAGQETWMCDVCEEDRPDEVIGVAKAVQEWPIRTAVTVRHCTDRIACIEAADTLARDRLMAMLEQGASS